MSTITLKQEIKEIHIGDVPAVVIENIRDFSVSQIFDCGQCFRFLPVGTDENYVGGVAFGRYVEFWQEEDRLTIINSTPDDYNRIWKSFLGLDIDYSEVKKELIDAFEKQGYREPFYKATEIGYGIRLLRQDKWECLCSFIISQNNNIPRIRKIIAAMCEKYGDRIEYNGKVHYSFPKAETLEKAGVDGLFALGTGFRAKYIYDAARAVCAGEIDLDSIALLDVKSAEAELLKIKGVGPKVAACAMLFSLDKYEAFPVDVWVKRLLEKYYPAGLDIASLGKYAGIAQQYLFYFERYIIGK